VRYGAGGRRQRDRRALGKVPRIASPHASEFARVLALPSTASSAAPAGRTLDQRRGRGVAVATLGAVAWMAFRSRGPVPIAFSPQSSNSPTAARGSRLSRWHPARLRGRDCNERGLYRAMVVRDIGDAGSITVMRGSRIRSPDWAANGRFLVAQRVTWRSDQHRWCPPWAARSGRCPAGLHGSWAGQTRFW
jgi:hypothetical protein